MGIIDPDTVDISNLQRQILHSTATIGVPKPDSAADTLSALNPDVKITKHDGALVAENAADIVRGYDVVIDACDNLPTRYVMNDACQAEKKPLVHGSIFQFDGRATVFLPDEGPCYRCLYLEPPPANMMPGPNDIGLLGVLPGVIGVVEATEAIKLVLGLGETLVGKLLTYNALDMKFQKLSIKKNPDCPVCNG